MSSELSTHPIELRTDSLCFSYPSRKSVPRSVIDQCTLSFQGPGHIGIIGANGSGKTTLFKLFIRFFRPTSGGISLGGLPLNQYRQAEIARHIAFVPQESDMLFPMTCWEVVMMGRSPYRPYFGRWGTDTPEDCARVETMMRFTETIGFATRSINELSGGERQRVFFARALVQDTPFLLLDEPTNHLDLYYQDQMRQWIAELVTAHAKTVISTLHHLGHARACTELILWRAGRPFRRGVPDELLQKEILTEVFTR